MGIYVANLIVDLLGEAPAESATAVEGISK